MISETLINILYLLIPGAFANIAPVLFKKINFLNYPIDSKLKLSGKRIFGDNKTWRGLLAGIILSILLVTLQKFLYKYEFFSDLSLLDYNKLNIFILGFLIGFGVLFGDLVGSFIKRRSNFKPGKSFYILDQINGGLGFVIFVVPFYFKSWSLTIWIISIWTIGHFVIKYLGYLLRLDDKKI